MAKQTAEQMTAVFLECLEVGLRHAAQGDLDRLDDMIQAADMVFSLFDGISGWAGDLGSFDVSNNGRELAPGDQIHAAWDKYCQDHMRHWPVYKQNHPGD